MTDKTELICKDCGYTIRVFRGWTFVDKICRDPGKPSLLHNWKYVQAK